MEIKRIYIIFIFVGILIFSLIAFNSLKAETNTYSVADLIFNAQKYDGKTVLIQGEVVGDVMERSDGVWLNVDDKGAVIGVFLPYEIFKQVKITYTGDYKHVGDTILVEGIFHRTWAQHNGEKSIEGTNIRVVTVGREGPLIISKSRLILTIGMFILLFVLIVVYHFNTLKSKIDLFLKRSHES
ncbi:hypothetical protein [Caldisericum sp. AR60]|uniref:hypothetical protein n=1 Tax=Caldisericum sp. AR60 TaxID=3397852 RepID=UPI0039FBCBDE